MYNIKPVNFVCQEDDDLEEALQSVKSSRLSNVEIKIPKANVGVIIGRAGSTIRDIQEQSNAKINFKGKVTLNDLTIKYFILSIFLPRLESQLF